MRSKSEAMRIVKELKKADVISDYKFYKYFYPYQPSRIVCLIDSDICDIVKLLEEISMDVDGVFVDEISLSLNIEYEDDDKDREVKYELKSRLFELFHKE